MMKSKHSIILFPIVVHKMNMTYIAYYKVYKDGYIRGDYNYNLKEIYKDYIKVLHANY